MEAPDKIYIRPIPQTSDGYIGIAWTKTHGKMDEYIHKDAILEWLNNEVERYNDKLIQPSNSKEEAIQIASSISSLLEVIAKLETLWPSSNK